MLKELLKMKLRAYLMEQVPSLVKMEEWLSLLKVTFYIVWKVPQAQDQTWALPHLQHKVPKIIEQIVGHDTDLDNRILLSQEMQFFLRNHQHPLNLKEKKFLQLGIFLLIVELINPI